MDMVRRIQLINKIAKICYVATDHIVRFHDGLSTPPWEEASKEARDAVLRYVEQRLAGEVQQPVEMWNDIIACFSEDLGSEKWSMTALHLPSAAKV